MKFTGERPTFEKSDEVESSRLRYHSIIPFCQNKSIIDIGCGIGHGSYYLAQHTSKQVLGCDISQEAIEEALITFRLPNLTYKTLDCSHISDLFEQFEVISMIEFIEHLEYVDAIQLITSLSEFKQTSIAFTTPNGDTFPYQPTSPDQYKGFHKWHYKLTDFNFLKNFYKFVEIYAHLFDPIINKFTSYVVFASNNLEHSLAQRKNETI